MLKGALKFRARIKGNVLTFPLFDFNPNELGIEATHTTNEQMALLRQKGEVEVGFKYFYEHFSERLRVARAVFHPVQMLRCENPMELISVAPSYPGAVRVCTQKKRSLHESHY